MPRADLEQRLRREGLEAAAWSNSPGDRYAPHRHDYDKVIVCVEGSIRFGLAPGRDGAELMPGDRLELPAGTTHDAVVGSTGVTCLEAHLPAASLKTLRHRAPGSW